MRLVSVVSTVALCVLSGERGFVRAQDDDGWDDEDDSLVVEDPEDELDSDIKEPPQMEEDTSLAEKADEHLSEKERKMRMALCIGVARERFLSNEAEMEKTVEMMKAIHNMEIEQAKEIIHINMIKNCYINFDEKVDIPAITAGDKDEEKYKAAVDKLISPPAMEEATKQPTLLSRQWDLIREVVEDERTKQSTLLGGDRVGLIGSKMGAFNKFLYFVSVFAAIFGGGYLLVRKLMQMEADKANKTKTKSSKKSSSSARASSAESAPIKKDQ